MRRRRWLVAPAIAALAAGCFGSSSAHPTLTEKAAIRQATADGLKVYRMPLTSWYCRGFETELGPAATTGRYASYTRVSYEIQLDDKRVRPGPGNTARIGMLVAVFPNASLAGRCARASLYQTDHLLVSPTSSRTRVIPHKMVSPVTLETHMHKPDTRGTFAGQDGEYDTFLADGRVLAEGQAYNERNAQLVEDDLKAIASQIAG